MACTSWWPGGGQVGPGGGPGQAPGGGYAPLTPALGPSHCALTAAPRPHVPGSRSTLPPCPAAPGGRQLSLSGGFLLVLQRELPGLPQVRAALQGPEAPKSHPCCTPGCKLHTWGRLQTSPETLRAPARTAGSPLPATPCSSLIGGDPTPSPQGAPCPQKGQTPSQGEPCHPGLGVAGSPYRSPPGLTPAVVSSSLPLGASASPRWLTRPPVGCSCPASPAWSHEGRMETWMPGHSVDRPLDGTCASAPGLQGGSSPERPGATRDKGPRPCIPAR